MPYGDKTGPEGRGPMTGRRAGFCSGSGRPGYDNPVPGFGPGRRMGGGMGRGMGRGMQGAGRGRGMGQGFGRGRGNFYAEPAYASQPYYAPASEQTAENERAYLEDLVNNLTQELEAIKARITELTKQEE